MPSSLPEPQKERGFPFTPSRKKKLLIFKRESTRCLRSTAGCYPRQREYPQPPPPSKNNTKRTINRVSMFHLCCNRELLDSSNPQRSCFP